jgi:hypothetical protein
MAGSGSSHTLPEKLSARLLYIDRPNQALERTAARRVFTFQMIKTVSVEAALALGGGRSAFSR